ncbi:hypothetical protein J5Y04_40965 [Kitasatospora sp. RG8]|uniref:hypothetical protein n=1 Tax=Kitasatospora sp. RG8 TaxID=2820815 RepID=UPI001AE0AE72|nr:hypothetical protein [Kitasatospora sp. RG8]MBP0455851.1 hypothetical protein [Kitasatospora sp. RG8]
MALRRATTERTERMVAAGPPVNRPLAVLTTAALLLLGGCATGDDATRAGSPATPGTAGTDRPTTVPGSSPGGPKAAEDRALPGGLGDPATAPTGSPVFESDGPRNPSYGGLGTLTACDSGRRLAVLDAPLSDVPDGARVGATAPTGANGEEWLVWTEPDGGLVLQSLLSSGSPVPRLVTAEPTGAVAVRDEASAGTTAASTQRWQLTDRRPQPGAASANGSATPDCLRIRTQDGAGCLLDDGADAPLVVGDCSSRAAWWSPQGLLTPTDL